MSALNAGLQRARELLEDRQTLAAEWQLRQLAQQHPGSAVPRAWLGALALQRDDAEQAIEWLEGACRLLPDDARLAEQLAQAYCEHRAADQALSLLRRFVAAHPAAHETQLVLANLLDEMGHAAAAVSVGLRAVTAAQAKGQWLDARTTPEHLHDGVAWWSQRVRQERRLVAQTVLDEQIAHFGRSELTRFERCVQYFLGEAPERGPAQSRQQPKFLYFPGLPEGPYHDPALQPWLPELMDRYTEIRAEAMALLNGDGRGKEDFLGFKPGDDRSQYVGGDGAQPAWDAWFFYRHGQRYDDNHRLAPVTSGALSRIELCEVDGQAPEICFSLLAPGSWIKRHFGVTNTRLVLHLPLLVPPDCALHVFGDAPHEWQEGRPMMFDDTFEHEAWNRSASPRMILLMDCWNPHLSLPERQAVRRFAERMTGFENADQLV